MPILAMSAGRVTAIWGNAYITQPDGSLKALQVGDRVAGGARIITENDGIVEISPTRGPAVLVKQPAQPLPVDKAIHAIESQDPDQAPGAGFGLGGSGSLTPALRVDRISEPGAGLDLHRFDAVAERAVIPDEGTVATPLSPWPGEAGPRVTSVELVAGDPGYLYFSVHLDKGSDLPVQLKLEVSPGGHDETLSDIWTGGIEYAVLDGIPQGGVDVAFEPGLAATPSGPIGSAAPGSHVTMLSLPSVASGGVVLVKVPLFVQADPDHPHVESVKLLASTPANDQPQWNEATLLHGEIDIAPVSAVMEGQSAVFELNLSHPLDRALPLKLTLLGDDDAADAGDVRAPLYVALSEDAPWQPLDADGVVVIPADLQHLRVRVDTVDDARLEDDESFRLSVGSVDGGVLITSGTTGHMIILDDDSRFDPVAGAIQPASVQAADATQALDARDVMVVHDANPPLAAELQIAPANPAGFKSTEIYITKSDSFAYPMGIFDAVSQAWASTFRELPNRHD
ncbi:MAG: hypothetical protein QM742_07240 [Aquabacterium sp.]